MLVIDAMCMDHQAMGRWGGISRSVDLCGYAAADPNRPTEDNQISFEPLLSRHTRPCWHALARKSQSHVNQGGLQR